MQNASLRRFVVFQCSIILIGMSSRKNSGKTFVEHLHDYVIPHERNNHRPNFFSRTSLGVFLIGLLILEAGYFIQTTVVFKKTNFLASVLPGVLVSLTNTDRMKESLEPLSTDPVLEKAAQLAAEDMAKNGYFAHVSPDGKDPWYWLAQVGYKYSLGGQNLAVQFSDSQDVETAWLNSPTHRANIMKARYTHIGIATIQGIYKGKETVFVVQYFATPKNTPITSLPSANTDSGETQSPKEVSLETAASSQNKTIVSQVPTLQKKVEKVSSKKIASTTVLGVESPVEKISTSSHKLEANTTLGAATRIIEQAPKKSVNLFAQVATSPYRTLLYVLAAMALTVLLFLGVALSMHAGVYYIEVIGGGLALLGVTLVLLLSHVLHAPEKVVIPIQSSSIEFSPIRPV
jgi:Cysteine-rich secretory protein family